MAQDQMYPTSGPQATLGSVDVALAHARQLLEKQGEPQAAAAQASEILKVVPMHPAARLILGSAQALMGNSADAIGTLAGLAREQPRSSAVHFELGLAYAEAGQGSLAIAMLRRAAALKPGWPEVWRRLAEQLDLQCDAAGADEARGQFLKTGNTDSSLTAAAGALVANDLLRAEALLRAHLGTHATDVAALRMLAEVVGRLRRYADAQRMLERCLQLAPGFDGARYNYVQVLQRQAKSAAALPEIERLLEHDPHNLAYHNLRAAILASLGDYVRAVAVLNALLRVRPRQPRIWISYGHALETAGRLDDSIAAYRQAIALEPTLGEAYWSLANLKNFRFSAEDEAAMRTAMGCAELGTEDRLHLEFALGKAAENAREYAQSFQHYKQGNGLRLRMRPYRAEEISRYVARAKALYTPEFLEQHCAATTGCDAADPIFILGMPRAGSTLIEQILSSHSMVEGTMELPDISALARELEGRPCGAGLAEYPNAVRELSSDALAQLGRRYLATTRIQRRSSAPFFIDKMPNNWQHVGLIHLILPNARIIDARRHPLGCCISNFKRHFARGQSFSYSLPDLGAYYRDYVELMAHFYRVIPGRVHRVI